MPASCPHCGAVISRVRRRSGPYARLVLSVLLLFGCLLVVLWLLLRML